MRFRRRKKNLVPFVVSKKNKQTNKKKKQWEHDGSKSASKIEVTVRSCSEKQFEKKKTLREALKFFDCCVSVRRQIQPSYKKIIRPHYVFALFGFVEVKKFRDSCEISD